MHLQSIQFSNKNTCNFFYKNQAKSTIEICRLRLLFKQEQEVGNLHSSKALAGANAGFSEGSLLGLIVFLIYINDLQKSNTPIILDYAEITTGDGLTPKILGQVVSPLTYL